jgi:hypothetical protein
MNSRRSAAAAAVGREVGGAESSARAFFGLALSSAFRPPLVREEHQFSAWPLRFLFGSACFQSLIGADFRTETVN